MDLFNIFFVNRGQLFVLEPQSPNCSIKSLQPQIRQITGVRPDDQVLLVSGGETLDTEKCVRDCGGFGTQSNPVFLFQRCGRKERDEVNFDQDISELTHIVEDAVEQAQRLDNSGDIKAIYIALPDRARQCKEAGSKSVTLCARLVQEHQFLHQGWLALVSNMDDSVARLKKRANRHKANLEKVRQQNEKASLILKDFDVCLEQLKNIIIPAAVIAHSRGTKDLTNIQDMSLYDWISQYDSECSLQELVDSVKDQFKLYGESDENTISLIFDSLLEQSKKECREIKGINKRLMQLDNNLVTMDTYNKNIIARVQQIAQSAPLTDAYAMQERVGEHRIKLTEICELLKKMDTMSSLFYKSKNELLINLRQRLAGWTVATYEKLHHCHNEIMVFEEKFNGLRQRLELIRQIKETPVLYVTAICEVVRRGALQKEFGMWHKQHADRCSSFSKDEDDTRSQISHKLDRHFLRVLFSGIFDDFPTFYIKALPPYDQEMPPVSADYVRQLRQNVRDLEQFIKVTSPQVFPKLSVRDAAMSSPQGSTPYMRREESFFTPDAVNNIAMLSRNFPSTNWLGGLDGFDNSPSMQPTIPMGNSPPSRTGSVTSMNIPIAPSLNHLSMLDEHPEGSVPSSLIAKSAPINIPAAPTREVSEKSSQFSTPEDHFNNDSSGELRDDGSSLQQFPVDDLTTRSQQSMEFYKSLLTEVAHLSKDLLDVRAEVVNRREQFTTDFSNLATYSCTIMSTHARESENSFAQIQREKDDVVERLESQLGEKDRQLQDVSQKIALLSETNSTLTNDVENLRAQVESLNDLAKENDNKVKEAEQDVFKKLTIEYELQNEKQRSDYEETIEQKDAEIRNLKKELEKRLAEIEHLKADPESEAFRKTVTADIRADLEKEFKSKTELIAKGMQQQREDAVARNKKEFEFEIKKATHQYTTATKFLAMERDLLRDALKNSDEGERCCQIIEDDVQRRLDQVQEKSLTLYARSVAVQTESEMSHVATLPNMTSFYGPSPPMMNESQYPDMLQSTIQLEVQQEDPSNKESHEICKSEGNLVECAVQTRIGLRSMDLMVSVQDIGEGATVLVIWSERHTAYILFSSSSYLHFVKESSVRRLGLSTLEGSRRNWIFGRVLHLDLCMIRKPTNRYNLPVDTRVYRVDVEAVPMEARNIRDTSSPQMS